MFDRFDTVAELFERDRTALLVEAMREYLDDRTDDAEFRRLVADRYFDGRFSAETVRESLGPETTRRLRLLQADAESEPLDLPAPGDESIYDGDRRTVDPDAGL